MRCDLYKNKINQNMNKVSKNMLNDKMHSGIYFPKKIKSGMRSLIDIRLRLFSSSFDCDNYYSVY